MKTLLFVLMATTFMVSCAHHKDYSATVKDEEIPLQSEKDFLTCSDTQSKYTFQFSNLIERGKPYQVLSVFLGKSDVLAFSGLLTPMPKENEKYPNVIYSVEIKSFDKLVDPDVEVTLFKVGRFTVYEHEDLITGENTGIVMYALELDTHSSNPFQELHIRDFLSCESR